MNIKLLLYVVLALSAVVVVLGTYFVLRAIQGKPIDGSVFRWLDKGSRYLVVIAVVIYFIILIAKRGV